MPSLRESILHNLDPLVWRSCRDISQRVNANGVDVGIILKILVEKHGLVERNTSKCDLPINFRYRLALQRKQVFMPPVQVKPQRTVTPEMLRECSQFLQGALLDRGWGAQTDLANALGCRQRYIAAILRCAVTETGASIAPAWVVLRIHDMAREQGQKT